MTPEQLAQDHCLALEGALELILPLAKGYAGMHPIEINLKCVEQAEQILNKSNEI